MKSVFVVIGACGVTDRQVWCERAFASHSEAKAFCERLEREWLATLAFSFSVETESRLDSQHRRSWEIVEVPWGAQQ